ncbi:MAG: hypothetical protein JWP78_1187 [Mucilaginibacter sp.]|nr:hypothetical protein [Mucilaginibacter sp.]
MPPGLVAAIGLISLAADSLPIFPVYLKFIFFLSYAQKSMDNNFQPCVQYLIS